MVHIGLIFLVLLSISCGAPVSHVNPQAESAENAFIPTSAQVAQLVGEYENLRSKVDELSLVLRRENRKIEQVRIEVRAIIDRLTTVNFSSFQSARIGDTEIPIRIIDTGHWFGDIEKLLEEIQKCNLSNEQKNNAKKNCHWSKLRTRWLLFSNELKFNYENLLSWQVFYQGQAAASLIHDNVAATKLADDIFDKAYNLAVRSANGIYNSEDRRLLQNRFEVYRYVARQIYEKWQILPRLEKVLESAENILTPENAGTSVWKLKYLDSNQNVNLVTLKTDLLEEEKSICFDYKKLRAELTSPTWVELDKTSIKHDLLCHILIYEDNLKYLIRNTGLFSKWLVSIPFAEITALQEPTKNYCSLSRDARIIDLFSKIDPLMDQSCL